MRITVDATSLLLRSAGVKNYTYYWLTHLRRQARPGEEIAAYPLLNPVLNPVSNPDRFAGEKLNHEASPLSFGATALRLGLVFGVNHLGSAALDTVLGTTDVFHASNMIRHAPGSARLTATLHDMTAFLMPELHTSGNVRADKYFADRILKRAHGLIAVSENTRQDAVRVLGIDPARITTIHSGVAEEYFNAAPAHRQKPYVLFVGAIEPRKNLTTLLDAWGGLPEDLRTAFDLVIAGPMAWADEAVRERIRAEATYLGYVPESELPGLTAGAAVFVYPSLYEGFGFPVAQAMAAGVPVVTSSVSSLPEIAGEGALLVDPRSPSEIGSALTRLLESEILRAELGELGRDRAQNYRWDKCAAESLEFFRRIGGYDAGG